MKKSNYIFCLIILALFVNCKKEEPITECESEPQTYNSDFELVWKKDSKRAFLNISHITNSSSSIIYVHNPSNSVRNEELIAFDKANGDTLWQYNQGRWYQTPQVYQDNYYVNIDGELVCIDAANGNEVWRINKGYLSHFMIDKGNIYAAFGDKITTSDSTQFFKITPSSGNETLLYSMHKSERINRSQNPKGMSLWQHPNGNEILIVHSDSYITQVSNSYSEYYLLDLDADRVYWDLANYLISGEVTNPIVDNYFVYLHTTLGEIAKLNLLTKSEIWKNFTRPFTGSRKMILANNLLYKSIGSQGGGLRIHSTFDGGIFKELGSEAQFGREQAGSTSNFRRYNNKLYFCNYNGLSIVNMLSNEIHRIVNRNESIEGLGSGEFAKSLDIDPSTNYIYTEIEGNIVCIKER